MVNDKAPGTTNVTAKPPPPKVVRPGAPIAPVAPKVAAPAPQVAPVAPPVTAPVPPPAPVLPQVTGPSLPLPPPPPPPQPPQVTGPPAPVQPPQPETPAAPEAPAEPAPPPAEAPAVAEKKVREYRYRTRILKAAVLPIFFSLMSFMMLYNYVTGYEPYFSYDFEIILAGFAVGLVVTTGFLVANMRVARRDGAYPSRQRNSIIIILAFLVPYLYLMLIESLSLAWKFSIGYFFSALLTPIVVTMYESQSHGKFYVQEEEVDDRLTRTLVFRA